MLPMSFHREDSVRITKATISKLKIPDGKTEHLVFDDTLPGFGLRLRAKGAISWVVQYRIAKRQRRMTIGKLAGLAPERARATAAEILAKVRLGEDPQETKLQARNTEPIRRTTFGEVAALYLDAAEERQRPNTHRNVRRHLNVDWRVFHALPIDEIDHKLVALELRKLSASGKTVGANRARANLKAMFSWAVKEGLATGNPVIGTNRPYEEKPRERSLTNDELQAIWKATDRATDYNAIVRLLILTGQRRQEIGGMRWQELELDSGNWVLPAERSKNHRSHTVPLSPLAKQIISSRPRQTESDAVYGRGDTGFKAWSECRKRLEKRLSEQASEMQSWRLHDIRRTVVTGMAEIGIAPHVIEAVVNHVSGHKAGVAGIYNRATYLPEKRQAMAIWADHIAAITAGERSKVVQMRRDPVS